ncbi:MAG: sulfur carrier protein ThiS [Bacteroidales bacterium]|nr:sulfur carrier protein ThiS [Bacteroidales bacterium]
MKIKLNNREEIFDNESMTLQELIDKKNFTFRLLVTKVNGQLVKKEGRENAEIKDGDNVAVIHLITGG